ncbi:3-phenylpropionate/cinnamic acid dioxygenase subunit beta [Mycobacterium sp. SMC-2]|uniref:aromatic-ring-hydroxylating dioxygenase subunit beta n=1 Tax=Mycobacterium sp. SMC-2 TaxID=2857058 RepID=UPI0021B31E6F|nr:3-phenylpropionate/cinnamic acid dioxygenase subunit beta [Mycobacterium sp. SMC-2]UXA05399.1 3-phenylpropionate/cinnamic acid dioxygenase subunit beta [Mycobacterium sp. SMC-2]
MTDPRYAEVCEWLIEEAELLDGRRFEDWLARVGADVSYRMPVRQTVDGADDEESRATFHYLDENYESLWVRVQRLIGGAAQSENPPSRTRRHVSNVRVATAERDDELTASSYLLLLRSRRDTPNYETISCERHDRLRRVDGDRLVLASREILVDQSSLGVSNLSIFL